MYIVWSIAKAIAARWHKDALCDCLYHTSAPRDCVIKGKDTPGM